MKHTELLRPILLQGLLRTEVPSEIFDFKKWISSGNYLIRDIPTTKAIEIEVNNEYSFNHMIAFDSCRMSCASFETMKNVQCISSLPKSFGWIAIKSYYAAFFSAHSIIRSFGYVCSQLERGHINQLNSYGSSVGLTNSIRPEAGFFTGNYNSPNRLLLLEKMNNPHEYTWKKLVECLQMISSEVLSVSGLRAHKQQLSAAIDDIVFRLTDKGRLVNGNYLSQYRNAVNYRQEHDAWHPYGKKSVKAEKVIRILSSWQQEENVPPPVWKESKDSYNFFLTCRDVISLNHQLIKLVIENSEKMSNMYIRWPNKLLGIAAAA